MTLDNLSSCRHRNTFLFLTRELRGYIIFGWSRSLHIFFSDIYFVSITKGSRSFGFGIGYLIELISRESIVNPNILYNFGGESIRFRDSILHFGWGSVQLAHENILRIFLELKIFHLSLLSKWGLYNKFNIAFISAHYPALLNYFYLRITWSWFFINITIKLMTKKNIENFGLNLDPIS